MMERDNPICLPRDQWFSELAEKVGDRFYLTGIERIARVECSQIAISHHRDVIMPHHILLALLHPRYSSLLHYRETAQRVNVSQLSEFLAVKVRAENEGTLILGVLPFTSDAQRIVITACELAEAEDAARRFEADQSTSFSALSFTEPREYPGVEREEEECEDEEPSGSLAEMRPAQLYVSREHLFVAALLSSPDGLIADLEMCGVRASELAEPILQGFDAPHWYRNRP